VITTVAAKRGSLVRVVTRYAPITAPTFAAAPDGRHPARMAAQAPTNTPTWMTR
jgi:hypothetical protein